MSKIPFLLVHGIMLWKLALAAFVIGNGLFIAHRLDGRRGFAVAALAAIVSFAVLRAALPVSDSGRAVASAPPSSP